MIKKFLTSLTLLVLVAALLWGCAPKPVEEPKEKLKVAFVYVGPIGDAGWNWAHDQGRLMLEKEVENIETAYIENVPEGADAGRVIEDYAEKGYDVIFTTSFGFMDPTIEVAAKYPDKIFMHCSGYKTADNVGTYFGRMYQPRYLSGLVAGNMTESNIIGYVAAFPIPEVIRGINAFTLGVREVNPDAKVHVVWTLTWYDPATEREAAEGLLDIGADVIAQHQDSAAPQQAAADRGKYCVGYDWDMSRFAPDAHLTAPIWNWGLYYVDVVKKVIDGTWESESYWGGMKEGIVDLSPIADFVPDDVKSLVEQKKQEILDGTFDVFEGPIKDQAGNIVVEEGIKMTDEEMLNMGFFVEGVVGKIE